MPYLPLDPVNAAPPPFTSVGDPLEDEGMSLLTLDNELLALLLGRTDVQPARRRLYLNLAYSDMASSLKLPEFEASIALPLVAGQHLYTLPSAVWAIRHVAVLDPEENSLESGVPLAKSDINAYRSRPLKDDLPEEYFKYGRLFVVWPTPDTATSAALDIRIRPAWLENDRDCPIFGSEMHEAILWLAKSKLHTALRQIEDAAEANNTYVDFIRKRLDPGELEEDTKIVHSSAPKSRRMLSRRRLPWTDRSEG